jgi:hypothetical protein
MVTQLVVILVPPVWLALTVLVVAACAVAARADAHHYAPDVESGTPPEGC